MKGSKRVVVLVRETESMQKFEIQSNPAYCISPVDHFRLPKAGVCHAVRNVAGITCVIRMATSFAASEVLMNEMHSCIVCLVAAS